MVKYPFDYKRNLVDKMRIFLCLTGGLLALACDEAESSVAWPRAWQKHTIRGELGAIGVWSDSGFRASALQETRSELNPRSDGMNADFEVHADARDKIESEVPDPMQLGRTFYSASAPWGSGRARRLPRPGWRAAGPGLRRG